MELIIALGFIWMVRVILRDVFQIEFSNGGYALLWVVLIIIAASLA
jgi:hypothetical protein